MRSFLSDFEITNTAELEAHINMNATAARANFEKHYADRLADPNRAIHVHKRRLDISGMADVNRDKNLLVVDLSTPKFDFSTLETLYMARLQENGVRFPEEGGLSPSAACVFGEMIKEERVLERQAKLASKINGDDDKQLTLGFIKCDYVNVDKVVKALVASTVFTRVSFANSAFSDDECDDFASLIRGTRSIRSLDLSGNKIGSEGIGKLVDAFIDAGVQCPITELNLGGNDLSKAAATQLARLLLSPSCTIQDLLLAGNKLGIYGAEELGKGIGGNATLSSVAIQNNNLGSDGFDKLVNAAFPNGTATTELVTFLMSLATDANRIDDAHEGIPQLKQIVEVCTRFNERRWALREWQGLEQVTRAEIGGLRLDELEILFAVEGQQRAAVAAVVSASHEQTAKREKEGVAANLNPTISQPQDPEPDTVIPAVITPAAPKAPSKETPNKTKTPAKIVGRAPSPGGKKMVTPAPTSKTPIKTTGPKTTPLPPKATPKVATTVKLPTKGKSRVASKSPMKKR